MTPKTIITYLVNGNPSGVKTVEFSNRLIKGVSIPRKDFRKNILRKELKYSGVYILIGSDELGNNLAYIGQATILKNRLNEHHLKKDFWNTAICFTHKDGSLTESDINYLEKELIKEAKNAERYILTNENRGNNGLIQEYRIPDMKEFLEDIKILTLNLGYSFLKKIKGKNSNNKNSNEVVYFLKNRGSNAEGIYTEEGFLVFEGSIGPKILQDGVIKNNGYAERNRPKFLNQNIIKMEDDKIIFLKNYLFSSPSSAASFVAGASLNGWMEWKDKNGKTLHENERESMDE